MVLAGEPKRLQKQPPIDEPGKGARNYAQPNRYFEAFETDANTNCEIEMTEFSELDANEELSMPICSLNKEASSPDTQNSDTPNELAPIIGDLGIQVKSDDSNEREQSDKMSDSPAVVQSGSSAASTTVKASSAPMQVRLLVRSREAGALIGKRGSNIERLRETYKNSLFSIPDTGNGPERVVCIASDEESLDAILHDITGLLLEKSPENDDQIELKLLVHSSHAGSIIGIGGKSIRKLRNDSKAAIKIYEMCCPLSNERVCAIKAKPTTVVSTIKLIHSILGENPVKGNTKVYDALNFDLSLVDKYGGYLPNERNPVPGAASVAAAAVAAYDLIESSAADRFDPIIHYQHQKHMRNLEIFYNPSGAPSAATKVTRHYSMWRAPQVRGHKDNNNNSSGSSTTKDSLEGEKVSPNATPSQAKVGGSPSHSTSGPGAGQTIVNNSHSGQNSTRLATRFHPYNHLARPSRMAVPPTSPLPPSCSYLMLRDRNGSFANQKQLALAAAAAAAAAQSHHHSIHHSFSMHPAHRVHEMHHLYDPSRHQHHQHPAYLSEFNYPTTSLDIQQHAALQAAVAAYGAPGGNPQAAAAAIYAGFPRSCQHEHMRPCYYSPGIITSPTPIDSGLVGQRVPPINHKRSHTKRQTASQKQQVVTEQEKGLTSDASEALENDLPSQQDEL